MGVPQMRESTLYPRITIQIDIWLGCVFLKGKKQPIINQPAKFLMEGC